jgi:hypothetical protein
MHALLNNAVSYVTKWYSLGSGIARSSEAKRRKIFKADGKQQDSDELCWLDNYFQLIRLIKS